MSSSSAFVPGWASAPGETILDVLKDRTWTVDELAQRLGLNRNDMDGLIQGRLPITIGLARQLERTLGASLAFWMARDRDYRQDTARLHGLDEAWLSELPVRDMVKFGWLTAPPLPAEEMDACLRFFDVPTVARWRETYSGVFAQVAFRTSPSIDSQAGAVAAWLRQGEILAGQIDCDNWDSVRLRRSLDRIRALSRLKKPNHFVPKLQQACAECGVAVTIVRAPRGCRASGATRFLAHDKALLMLSFRHLTDDHFWFTFFHEVAHLILHGERALFLEWLSTMSTREEDEANEFAARRLIPPDFEPQLRVLGTDPLRVIKFASEVGVSPGIVVGQLQHLRLLRPNQMNRLKRRFTWFADS